MNRVLPLMAVATFLLTGCPSDGLQPGRDLDVTRITPNAPGTVTMSGYQDPQRLTVFDAATFAEAWGRAFASQDPAPKLPEVDFATEFVVVAALGGRATGGYAIEVVGAKEEEGGVVVALVTTSPGKGCPVTLATTQPLDIVKVKRPGAGTPNVSFTEKQVVTSCGP